MNRKSFYIFFAATTLFSSCGLLPNSHEDAMETAWQWADAYFCHDYHTAKQYVTHESQKWLQFAASNVSQHDLDILRDQSVQVDVDHIEETGADSVLTAVLEVNNFVAPALLGQESVVQENGLFNITLVERDGRWLVKMDGLPRNERQSHDASSDK